MQMSITLVTKDGAKVHVCSRIASNFGLVTSIIEDLDNETVNTEFPISEVDSTILAHALAFYSEECDKDTERTPCLQRSICLLGGWECGEAERRQVVILLYTSSSTPSMACQNKKGGVLYT